MVKKRVHGPGKSLWRNANGTWGCKAWNGVDRVVEVDGSTSREQAERQADFELATMSEEASAP